VAIFIYIETLHGLSNQRK